MPLRSVEAASRDDAIAAAREQFGPQARVVGVRRVRSGGVLGFFATERYVAEVAAEPLSRPVLPVPSRSPVLDDDVYDAAPSDFSSPLASAAPAGARAAAPARNGAAAWAAEAVRTTGAVHLAASPRDDERVSELAGLLAGQQQEPEAASSRPTFPRVAFPRTASVAGRNGSPEDDGDDQPVRGPRQRMVPAGTPASAPSPFTAALARMVAGDQDVRQAVQEALERPVAGRPPATTAPSSTRPGSSAPAAETSVTPSPTRQEEETVGDRVPAPPPPVADHPVLDDPVEVPTWAAEPDVSSSSTSPREEAIADLLRGALAQGHSDEALAGILRKVLAGASPQTALDEPDLPAPLAVPVAEVSYPTEPVAGLAPVPVPEPVVDSAPDPLCTPSLPTAFSSSDRSSGHSMWGTPTSQSLWAEPSGSTLAGDAPIRSGVSERALDTESSTAEAAVAEPVVETSVAAEDAVPDTADESVVEDVAPLLARTASDPAPMMSLDSTSIMPPLSLLPPLPGSRPRGRRRPPVPPADSRRVAAATSAPAAAPVEPEASEPVATHTETVAEATVPEPAPPVSSSDDLFAATPVSPEAGSAVRSLATVTRLHVPPLEPAPGTPETSEQLFGPQEPAPVAAPTEVDPAASAMAAQGDVADRLHGLGLPAHLLGSTFTDDVAEHGVYSALTRALSVGLPRAPSLPDGAGEVLFVVGPGVETLRAAQSLAASLRLDPDRVQWATRGDLAGLAPARSRVTTTAGAVDRQQEAAAAGTVTIVAVHAPLRSDAYWTAQMMAIWSPVAVWAVVEATRKPEDLEPWLDGLPEVDALMVQDTDLSADPAAVLRRVDTPVVLLDGARATPHRWASLLCERLESAKV